MQISFFDVARMRADPLLTEPAPRDPLTENPTAVDIPNITVAPGATAREFAAASLITAPPAGLKTSTPTCIVAVSVEVQERKVDVEPFLMTPGTE